MAAASNTAIFEHRARPLIKTGERSMSGKHGAYVLVFVRYIDGYFPSTDSIPRGLFAKLKRIRGGQAVIWERVGHLVMNDRMEPRRALAQATAEYSKGILAG